MAQTMRRAGQPWTEEPFFDQATRESEGAVSGLRVLLRLALAHRPTLNVTWGSGDDQPRFMIRREGSGADLVSGWASGKVGVQVGTLQELLVSTSAIETLASAANLPSPPWRPAAEPRFDAELLDRPDVQAAMGALLMAISGSQPGHKSSPETAATRDTKTWLLLTFGDERQYAGNRGYEDDPSRAYRYDSFVPNFRQVAAGDAVVLQARDKTLGCARIERIDEQDGVKDRQRCPECRTTAIKTRRTARPLYRCDRGHEFDEPLSERVPCKLFAAHFGSSFVPVTESVDVQLVRAACRNYNGQLAMQQIDPALIAESPRLAPIARALTAVRRSHVPYVTADEGDTEPEPGTPYEPTGVDTRETVMRQVRARRGQAKFRQKLREAYGDVCVVTGCTLVDLLEAAHISPYRGAEDNHAENGLLLRADVHTLFDLDLLGIEPETLTVHLHPEVRVAGYAALEGQLLRVGTERPSRAALEFRWAAFQARRER